jgi:hypothetical protein
MTRHPPVDALCDYCQQPFTAPYAKRRRFCSRPHANAANAARRNAHPAGFSTIKDLAERYGYTRGHIGRLIASGALVATFSGRYLVSASAEQSAVARGVFTRGGQDKAGRPLTEARSARPA